MKGCCWINSVFLAKLLNLPKAMINNSSQSSMLKSRIKTFFVLIPNLLPALPTISHLPCILKIAWSFPVFCCLTLPCLSCLSFLSYYLECTHN